MSCTQGSAEYYKSDQRRVRRLLTSYYGAVGRGNQAAMSYVLNIIVMMAVLMFCKTSFERDGRKRGWDTYRCCARASKAHVRLDQIPFHPSPGSVVHTSSSAVQVRHARSCHTRASRSESSWKLARSAWYVRDIGKSDVSQGGTSCQVGEVERKLEEK